MNDFHHSWSRAWSAQGAQGSGQTLMEQLLQCYREPQRKYHTLVHLKECLAHLEPHLSLAEHPADLEMALWFHDAVYDVKANDNEVRSAFWAELALNKAKVNPDSILRIKSLIMATRHDALPENPDQNLVVDVDLAILGASESRYRDYENQVREEYQWVPEPLFRSKRMEILRGFLKRKFIYNQDAFRRAFETRARQNLTNSILRLGG